MQNFKAEANVLWSAVMVADGLKSDDLGILRWPLRNIRNVLLLWNVVHF